MPTTRDCAARRRRQRRLRDPRLPSRRRDRPRRPRRHARRAAEHACVVLTGTAIPRPPPRSSRRRARVSHQGGSPPSGSSRRSGRRSDLSRGARGARDRERLTATLRSIADAVVTVDREGASSISTVGRGADRSRSAEAAGVRSTEIWQRSMRTAKRSHAGRSHRRSDRRREGPGAHRHGGQRAGARSSPT